jgi:cardiolipin synthase
MKEKLGFLFENWKTVPNLLSAIRIVLIPVFAVLFYKDHIVASVIVLGLSALSDLFDGKIARRFNQVSNLGKILDPIADKLTVAVIALMLFLRFKQASDVHVHAFAWVFLLFIAKDVFMLCGGAFMLAHNMRPNAAEIYGKAATVAFYVVMLLIFAFGPEVGAFKKLWVIPSAMMEVLVVIAVIMTFAALASYMPSIYDQFARHYHWGKYKNMTDEEIAAVPERKSKAAIRKENKAKKNGKS